MEKAKNVRRVAKGILTRTLNAGKMPKPNAPHKKLEKCWKKLKPPTLFWYQNTKPSQCI